MPNRLLQESSPYLRQHAHNPVDWFPWGEAAFAKAKAENKPIFLSVGYSACHWCHVMERESFENVDIAALMNEHFVNVKVDREERPDVDHIYMSAVQLLTGRGGWPMSVFLTPSGEPFYGGTYFPPEDRHGMPGFARLLTGIAQAFRDDPEQVQANVVRLMQALRSMDASTAAERVPGDDVVLAAAQQLARSYDAIHGGLGQAPKFPNEAVFELFLRVQHATAQPPFLDMVLHTLRKMGEGGLYDQLGGGFHRYSVDDHWLVPHFEKMLYDNALLVPLYLAAARASGDPWFARIARESLDYVLREMTDPNGGFYSTQDADSEGEEGKFFVWSLAEVQRLVELADLELVCRAWDLTEVGNFEGHNILHVTVAPAALAQRYGRTPAEVEAALAKARATLFAARAQRVPPARDDKVLTAWNGLMISAMAQAAETLADERYAAAARAAVAFVESTLTRGDRLLSTYKDGVAKLNGYLDDYAFYLAGLLDVFELTQEASYLQRAEALCATTLRHFWDSEQGGFFFTSDDHEELIVRSKPTFDGSIPSGNSVMTRNLLRLHALTGQADYLGPAETVLRIQADGMRQQPFAMANLLCALDLHSRTATEIVLVGGHDDAATKALLAEVRRAYVPNRSLRLIDPQSGEALPEMLAGKGMIDGRATAYVCEHHACSAPMTSPQALAERLRA